jgi:hypothetical protein
MLERIVGTAWVFLVPLFPAFAIYSFIQQPSFAQYKTEATELGGPIAAYFVFLLFSYQVYTTIKSVKEANYIKQAQLEEMNIQSLIGNWTYSEIVQENGNATAITGTATFKIENGKPIADGIGFLPNTTTQIYSWNSTAILPGENLWIVIYRVDGLNRNADWEGVMELRVSQKDARNKRVTELVGTFKSLEISRRGNLTLTRV